MAAARRTEDIETTAEDIADVVEAHVANVKAKSPERLSIDVEVPVGTNGKVETKTITYRSFNLAPLGILRHTRGNQQEQMWAIFEWALAPEDLDVLDRVPSHKLNDLLIAMQTASGIAMGES
jgi:hypothetical protein